MKVYIVTGGDYSDYHISAVFSTRTDAENYCSACSGEWWTPRVEEWPLDSLSVDTGMKFYFGRVNPENGAVFDVSEASNGRGVGEWQKAVGGTLFTVVVSKSETHAVKSIADKYRQAKAEGIL